MSPAFRSLFVLLLLQFLGSAVAAAVGLTVPCTAEGYYPLYCTERNALINDYSHLTNRAELYAGAFMPREPGDESDVFLGDYPDDGGAETCPCDDDWNDDGFSDLARMAVREDDNWDDGWDDDDGISTFPPTAAPQGIISAMAAMAFEDTDSTPTPGVDPASVGVDVACTAEGHYPLYCTRNDALMYHSMMTIDAEKYAGAFMPRERGDEDDVFLGTYPDDGEAETCPCNFNTPGETLKPTPAPNCDDDFCGGTWESISWDSVVLTSPPTAAAAPEDAVVETPSTPALAAPPLPTPGREAPSPRRPLAPRIESLVPAQIRPPRHVGAPRMESLVPAQIRPRPSPPRVPTPPIGPLRPEQLRPPRKVRPPRPETAPLAPVPREKPPANSSPRGKAAPKHKSAKGYGKTKSGKGKSSKTNSSKR